MFIWLSSAPLGWPVVPDGFRRLLGWISHRYHHPEIIVTENGCASPDRILDGQVDDAARRDYLGGYLTAAHHALADGAHLGGYFVWSLMDNFEWAQGYAMRFGLHHVDFATGTRTPKASAHWYRDVIARHGLAEAAPPARFPVL